MARPRKKKKGGRGGEKKKRRGEKRKVPPHVINTTIAKGRGRTSPLPSLPLWKGNEARKRKGEGKSGFKFRKRRDPFTLSFPKRESGK